MAQAVQGQGALNTHAQQVHVRIPPAYRCCRRRTLPSVHATVGTAQASPTVPNQPQQLITFEEVQQAARHRGLVIKLQEIGPWYTITCAEGEEGGKTLALTTGFVVPPLKLMHCDTLQVFTRGLRGDEGQRVRGGALGLGLLMGGAVFSHGWRKGCHKAEILAINDDDTWHERLVKYYRFFGFRPVVKVEGDKLSDLPHMLVWGGAGTRMDADVAGMLQKWTPSLRRAAGGMKQQTSSSGHAIESAKASAAAEPNS